MNRKLILLSFIAVLALGGTSLLFFKQLRATKERERAVGAMAEAEAAATAAREEHLAGVERERERVIKQNIDLADLAKKLRQSEAKQASNVAALVQQMKTSSPATAGPAGPGTPDEAAGGKGMGDMIQKMMKDPAMKEMMRNQQKAMMKTMYGPLFKDLNLPIEQQKQLTDLMLDSQMSSMDSAAGLLGEDAAGKTNAINAITDKQKTTSDQIKALLGDEKFAQYEEYQKSIGDRMILNMYQQQAAGTETALRDAQLKQLTQLMSEERVKVPPVIGEDPAKAADSLAKMMDEETLNKQFQWQEDFNKRVFERAGQMLSPDQLKEFADFQAQQLNTQKLGLKMAREMFGAGKPAGGQPGPSAPVPAAVK